MITNHLGEFVALGTANVLQQSDYYPFGMKIAIGGANNDNKYIYNGKEFQYNTLGGVGLD